VALAVVVGAAHSLGDAVTATVGVASRRRHQRLVAMEQLATRQAALLRFRLQAGGGDGGHLFRVRQRSVEHRRRGRRNGAVLRARDDSDGGGDAISVTDVSQIIGVGCSCWFLAESQSTRLGPFGLADAIPRLGSGGSGGSGAAWGRGDVRFLSHDPGLFQRI